MNLVIIPATKWIFRSIIAGFAVFGLVFKTQVGLEPYWVYFMAAALATGIALFIEHYIHLKKLRTRRYN